MNYGISYLTGIGIPAHSCLVDPKRHEASHQQVVAVQSRESREAPFWMNKR